MLSSIYYGCKLEQESKNYIYEMQKERYKVFKSQDSTNEQFDVIFEIEGKKIYASKYVLISVSEYMNAFLSDRWLKKDEVIKIETYSYDSFYQFLCFLYSGHCHLTTQNVYELTDMAESYAVSCLKDFCDKYCFGMNKTIESIEELTEFALKYSLPQLTHSIKSFIMNNSDKVYNNKTFIAFKKPFVEFVSSIYRVHDSRLKRFENSSVDGNRNESGFFESIYNWAEHQVMKQKDSNDCNVNLLEAVKAELSNILPGIKYCNMRFDFLMNFVVEKGFILSPAEFKEIHSGCFAYNSYHVEKRFKCIYELAEKQASQKQKISPNQDFNVVDSIKTDLTEVLSDLKFGKMGKEFLMNFVVANGIITEEQVKHVYDTRVEIQNAKRSIHGLMKGDLGIRLASEAMYFNNYVDQYSTTITRFSRFNFSVPKTPSTLMKMKGCDWYLCLENDGFLAFKHHTRIVNTDYLLAEMKSEAEFYLNENRYTYIYAEYVNLSDINDNDSNMRRCS
uniref:BTB domain-containing protein n=1 Tax=Panagrolaimus davidi TaxID=227884 RepID=A0A914R5L0_9BILA